MDTEKSRAYGSGRFGVYWLTIKYVMKKIKIPQLQKLIKTNELYIFRAKQFPLVILNEDNQRFWHKNKITLTS